VYITLGRRRTIAMLDVPWDSALNFTLGPLFILGMFPLQSLAALLETKVSLPPATCT
jgi:hypothetical protein